MMKDFNQIIFSKKMYAGVFLLLSSMGIVKAGTGFTEDLPLPNVYVSSPQQAKSKITGTIVDQTGEAIIGANVVEKGTLNGTITDIDGKFTLDVSSGAVLIVSYIGFTEQQITVGNQRNVSIVLQEDTKALDEVVVVGYGVQKKVNMTGSVSTISADAIEARPVTNVSTALAGLAAGVRVNQTSARPGDDGANIRIRGMGALNDDNAGALVVIDGIPGTLDAVNPNDVESISILKDAASAAIYGTRAANGVILVTTKKGNAGKPKVSFTGTLSLAQATRLPEFVNDYANYMELYNEGLRNSGIAHRYPDEVINKWREAAKDPNGISESGYPNYIAYPNTDWAEAIFQSNLIQNYNLSVTGGSETSKYALSAGYLNNPGLIVRTGVERFQTRINLETKVAKVLTLGTQTFMSMQKKGLAGTDNAKFGYLRQTIPGQYPHQVDGYWALPSAVEESSTTGGMMTDAWFNTGGKSQDNRVNTTLFARIDILKGLSFETKVNYQNYNDESRTYPVTQYKMNFATGLVDEGIVSNPSEQKVTYSWKKSYTLTYDNVLTYNFSLKNAHNFGILLGHNEYYWNEQYDFSASKLGMIAEGLYVPDAVGEDENTFKGKERDRAMRSYFGRINYDYKSKYLFEFNMRYDGSSRFGTDKRWGIFPSVSGGWRITEEAFAEGWKDYVQNLKVRASWGRLGSDNAGNYDHQAYYDPKQYVFGGKPVQTLVRSKMGNTMLQWEETDILDIAVEGNMFDGRASFEIDYYNKYTKGILTTPAIPLVAGDIKGPTLNTSDVVNRGVEITLGWRDRIGKVNYSVRGNFAYNFNQVKKYKGAFQEGWEIDANGNRVWKSNLGDVADVYDNTKFVLEGHQVREFYLRDLYSGDGTYFHSDGSVNIHGGPKDGMIRTEKDMEWVLAMKDADFTFSPQNNIGQTQLYYGDFIYADLNGDGIYGDNNDRKFTGKSELPKFNYGLNIDLEWNNFDLSMIWAGSAGMYYYLHAEGYNGHLVRTSNAISKLVADDHYYYSGNPNDPANNLTGSYPRLMSGEGLGGIETTVNGAYSTRWLYNASYLKLKNLQVGYTIPSHLTNKLNVGHLRLFFTGENLLTITKYPFMDPERGAGIGYLPMKQFAFGLNLNF